MIFAATPPYDGTLKTFYNLPHHLCYKLPDWLSLEEAALCEPLSVALHAILTTGQIKPNQSGHFHFELTCHCPLTLSAFQMFSLQGIPAETDLIS